MDRKVLGIKKSLDRRTKREKCQWTVKCLDEKSHWTVDLKRKKVNAPYASAPVTYHGKLGSGPKKKRSKQTGRPTNRQKL